MDSRVDVAGSVDTVAKARRRMSEIMGEGRGTAGREEQFRN
jgi:hypothetical protein